MELSEFLLARIAEDEGMARHGEFWDHSFPAGYYEAMTESGLGQLGVTGKRVLAECAAKRRIVEVYNIRHLLEILVQPYADHPDYRQEWLSQAS